MGVKVDGDGDGRESVWVGVERKDVSGWGLE